MKFRIRWFLAILCFLICILIFLFFFKWRYIDDDGPDIIYITEIEGRFNSSFIDDYIKTKNESYFATVDTRAPVLVWWTPFTYDTGSYIRCNDQTRCFISNVRKYRDNKEFSAFLFYGTDFHLHDLPLPRHEHEHWALIHEESPKNNYAFSFESIMNMFNHTATFKRHSDVPVTTQYLASIDDLLNHTYVIGVREKTELQKTENLAPIIYIQSDCNTPSDRDIYIQELMKYVQIDSYGACLHNKDLPEHLRNPIQGMEHHETLKLVGKYKFALAFENAVCTDYITEKFWRPLKVGTVPIVYGSDQFQDFLPDNHSAISMLEFATPADLAHYIHELNMNDTLYDSYRQFKLNRFVSNDTLLAQVMSQRKWGINNDHVRGSFVNRFECLVCERVHKTRQNSTLRYQAKFDDYGCPPPTTFDKNGQRLEVTGHWYRTYEFNRCKVEVFNELINQKLYNFTEKDLYDIASKRFSPMFRKNEFLR